MPTIPLKFGRQDSAQRPVSLAMFMMAFVLLCASSAHAATFYVSTSGNNANSGTDWSQAKQSVQAGINASQAGDQVWVAQGTYTGLVTLKKSVAVYGGFNGTETQLIQRSNTSNLTILDGNQQGSVVTTPYDTTIGPDTLIDGFTIRNGSAQFGGGVLLSSVSPTISNNVIIGNFADNYGGGIFAGSGSATIKNNTVIGNTVRGQGYYGGGIMCSGGNPTVIGNTIKYNKADNGGGIYYSATGTIANNKIIANMAGQSGAGIYVQNAQPIIKNNVIYANVAMPNGQAGGIGLSSCSSATISGNLIFANLAYQSPGVQSYLSQTTMINNTVVNNQGIGGTNGSIMMMGTGTGISTTLAGNIIAYNQIGLYASPNVAVSLSHNDVFGNTKNYVGLTTGLTDVSVDPLFADLAGANFHLLSDSPVIDAGDDSYYVAGDLDLDGNSRFSGLHIDMGAYEFASSTSAFSLTTLSPASTTTDAGTAVTLTLTGTGFVSGSVAFWNGAPLATTAISSTQLTAQVPAALVASIDLATVTIANPDGSVTNARYFQVVNPVPVLNTISPTTIYGGSSDVTLSISGSRFTPTSIVTFTDGLNTVSLSTTTVSSTSLTAVIPAFWLTRDKTTTINVINPVPGGGQSASVPFTVLNPVPVMTSISPSNALAGSASFTLTVNGSNFDAVSVVNWNGSPVQTNFISTTQLTAIIPASLIATVGSDAVTVVTPAAGGGTSSPQTFTVYQTQIPVLTSISPTSVTQGSSATTITATGSNFLPTSVVNIQVSGGNQPLTTTFVSATQLTAVIPASYLTVPGYVYLTVTNPGLGGGTSYIRSLVVVNPVPTITTLAPTFAFAGGASFTLTVNGTGFVSSSQAQTYPPLSSAVLWNGQRLTTTFVSPTQLTATVPASSIASAGTASITVLTTGPGGGTSNAVAFPIVASNLTVSAGTVYNTNSVTGTLTLAAPASASAAPFSGGATGVYAPITSSNAAATFTLGANLVAGPDGTKYVYLAPGQTSGTFTIATSVVTSVTTATITATYAGAANTANLTITPTQVSTLAITPTNLNPGAVATGTLTLNGPAVAGAILSGQTRAGTYVPLITSSPYLFISGQPIVRSASGQQYAYFAVGQTSVTFSCVSASPPSTLTVSVTATLNGSTATANVIVVAGDHTPPVTTASLSGTQGSNGWYLGPVQVTLTATDDSSGVSATYYVLDGSTTATIYSSPFTISSDGVHTIKYWSLDKAGNTETTKTQTIKIDSISPTIAFGTPTPAANTAGWNNTAVDVPYTTSDATSGVASTTPGSPVHFASEGLHQVQTVTATDNAGNGVSSVTPQVNIDLTAPVSTGTLNGTLVTLSATDVLSGVKSTNYTVDGGTVQPYSAPFHVAGEGTHTVLYWSTDNADNVEAAKNLTLTTDTTAPTTTASLSGTQGNSGWYTSSVQVTLTATDTLSGVAATYYTIDGGTQQTYSAPFTVSGDAIHAITFYSVDNAGNTESTQSQTVKIDGTAPVTTGSSDSGQVTLTASDNLSGIASTYDTIDGGAQQTYSGPFTVGVGTHTVQYWSVDVAGNTETAKSLTVTLNAAPTLTSLNPSSANAGNPAFTLAVTGTGFVNGSVVNWNGQALATTYVSATSLTASVAASLVAAPGTASVTVTTPAPGGGTSNALSFTIVDVTPPTTTITLSGTQGSNAWTGSTAFNGWYRSAVQVTLTVTSTNANATTITTYYTVDGDAQHTYTGSFTVSSDGIHSVTYWSADQTGDTEASKAQTIKIDATKPVVTFGTPSPAPNAYGWNNTPVTIPYTSSDATSGIGFDPGPHPLPFTYEGYQAWDLDIFDVAGNELQIESPTVNSDYTAPVTTASVSGATVTLSASDSLSGIAHTYYTIDSGSQQAYSSAITVGQGTHVVHYWSVDKADNSETAKSVSVSVDTTPPTTTATPSGTLGSNGWYTSSVQVTMAATDTGSGVAATYYKLDGGVQQTYSSAVTISAAGSHTIQYWSVDNAGNTESVKSLAIKIDSTAPVTTGSVSGAQVTLSASDSTSGVAATYYTIDSGSQQTYSAPFTVTGSGSHTVTYRSVDNAGNSETAKTLSVTVNAVPTITTLSPSSVNAGSAAFTLTITGTGYVNGSVIKWNGTALTTTYVSATSLTASIAATLVATAGTASVTVTTPGGTSNAATFTINAVSSPVTVTPSVASNSNYFGQENVTIANTQTITALTVTITVQRTTGVAYSGEYTNYAGGSITMANSSTASQVTYTYTLGAGKTVGVGSGWLTAAQFSGTGSVHPTTGDTYSVTCTAGGVVRTFSGHF